MTDATYLELLGDLAIALAGLYGFFALIVTLVGIRPSRRPPDHDRPVTVLKPLCGNERGLYSNLRSFCEQSHSCFQIVFGTNRRDDPALAVVDRLSAEYPHLDITVSRQCAPLGCNLKVANLARMLAYARYDTLVIADSDIRVPRDYLARVLAPLAERGVGLVSCLYTSRTPHGLWSRLAGHYIDDWFVPSVLVSRALGGRLFAFGATLALTRETLDRIGGFESIADYLADDYIVGARIRARGLTTVLSDCVVETETNESSLTSLLTHEKRWMQTIRSAQPIGYAFSFVTLIVPLGVIGWLLAFRQPYLYCFVLLLIVLRCGIRLIGPWRGWRQTLINLALVPVRDALTACAWVSGLFGRHILWRNRQFALGRNGYLKPITSEDKP